MIFDVSVETLWRGIKPFVDLGDFLSDPARVRIQTVDSTTVELALFSSTFVLSNRIDVSHIEEEGEVTISYHDLFPSLETTKQDATSYRVVADNGIVKVDFGIGSLSTYTSFHSPESQGPIRHEDRSQKTECITVPVESLKEASRSFLHCLELEGAEEADPLLEGNLTVEDYNGRLNLKLTTSPFTAVYTFDQSFEMNQYDELGLEMFPFTSLVDKVFDGLDEVDIIFDYDELLCYVVGEGIQLMSRLFDVSASRSHPDQFDVESLLTGGLHKDLEVVTPSYDLTRALEVACSSLNEKPYYASLQLMSFDGSESRFKEEYSQIKEGDYDGVAKVCTDHVTYEVLMPIAYGTIHRDIQCRPDVLQKAVEAVDEEAVKIQIYSQKPEELSDLFERDLLMVVRGVEQKTGFCMGMVTLDEAVSELRSW